MTAADPFRPITQRLNSTAVEDLPRYAGFLAASILNNAESLRQPERQKDATSLALNKLKVRVSSLVQDKTVAGRYTGIILIKAIVDAGGVQVLAASTTWARNLLSCLNKPDPPEVKKLAIITLTRIFLLTRASPSLLREITTPALPAFMSTCLSLIRPLAVTKIPTERTVLNPLLATVLQCWDSLIYDFSTTIKPNSSSIREIAAGVISDDTTPETTRRLAIQIFAKIHYCAPKTTIVEEWKRLFEQTIEASHQSADVILRSILEDWASSSSRQSTSIGSKSSVEAKLKAPDALGLGRWRGLEAGAIRLASLLDILGTLLVERQKQSIALPLTPILDLVARLASVVPPSTRFALRHNPEIGRDERDELWFNLPRLHTSVLTLLNRLSTVCGQILRPASRVILSQIMDIFEASTTSTRVRCATYEIIQTLIQHDLAPFSAVDTLTVATLVRACCSDAQSAAIEMSTSKVPVHGDAQLSQHANLTLNQPQSAGKSRVTVQAKTGLQSAAWNLLPSLVASTSSCISSGLRAELDRTTIVLEHADAILASILYPLVSIGKGVNNSASLLPFLSRIASNDLASEALLRPRMPIIRTIIGDSEAPAGSQNEPWHEVAASDSDVEMDPIVHNEVSITEKQVHQNRSDTPGLISPRKRDFTVIEQERLGDGSEFLKRARTDHDEAPMLPAGKIDSQGGFPVESDHIRVPDQVPMNRGIYDSLDSKFDGNAEIHVSATQINDFESTHVLQQQAPKLTGIAKKMDEMDETDSSDDDEIPAIDATISEDDNNSGSGEEEEADEDEDVM